MRPPLKLSASLAFIVGCGLSLSCSSAETSVVGPTTDSKCQIAASNSPASFAASGGTGTVTISTSRDCTWTIATSTSWVTLNGDRSGQGGASVGYTVAANPVPAGRSGTIVVASQTVEVSQAAAPCRYNLSRTRDQIGPGGGALSVAVSTLTGCNWTATSKTSWIVVTSGQSGNGNGTVGISVAANGGDQRVGEVDVSGQIYTVAQDAVPSPPPPPAPPVAPAPSPQPSPAPTPERVHVEGRVSNVFGQCPILSFTVNGVSIVTTTSTDYKRGNCGHVQSSRSVEVTGFRLTSGVVQATDIQISRGNDATEQE